MIRTIPVAPDLSIWYAGPFVTAYAGIAALAAACAWASSRPPKGGAATLSA